MYKGIDISHWQGKIDFQKVKDSGIEFVIIKAGGSDGKNGTRYKDVNFESYYRDAKAVGLAVGSYFFTGKQCINAEQGIQDALYFINLLKDKQFEFPVCIDVEAQSPVDRKGITDATIAFCQTLEDFRYYAAIYSSDVSGFIERLELNRLTAYDKWVARYGKEPQNVKNWGMYQYSSKGNINGINTNVDLDYARYNYSRIMKVNHLNGY